MKQIKLVFLITIISSFTFIQSKNLKRKNNNLMEIRRAEQPIINHFQRPPQQTNAALESLIIEFRIAIQRKKYSTTN